MKITSKNLLVFLIVFFLVIAGLIGLVIFSTPDPQSDVIVSYQRPASFDLVKSTPSGVAPVGTAAQVPTETEIPIPADQWVLKIQDPISDPIPAGTVAFGSGSLSFTGGSVIVPATAPHELRVLVSAEGYAPGEFTVTPGSSPLVLDYLCDFYILVEDENGNPVPNTAIRVWKSNPPPRPAGDQAAAYFTRNLSLGNSIRLTRSAEECRVKWVDKPQNSFDINGSPDGEVFPKAGDMLMALGACTWQARYTPLYINQGFHAQRTASILGEFLPFTAKRSSRLRIWDTLRLTEQADSSRANMNPQVLEILRENQLQFYYQIFPECPENQPPLREAKTDGKGELMLRGVPPALYYVQAFDSLNRCSGILPLHPACGGARLRLKGEGEFRVYVERDGIPAKDKYFIKVPDAAVTLQSLAGIKLYSQKSDYSGEAFYKNLPYGKYRLTVKALDQTVEKTITFNKPVDSCFVTLRQDELYNVTGIVLEQDSGAPVPGYTLELNTDMAANGNYVYQEVISDATGCFEFHNVIPGKYSLAGPVKLPSELKYFFSNPAMSDVLLTESSRYSGIINLNVYEDVHDLKILLKPVVKTKFSGIVVDKNNIPAANAIFTVDARMKGEGRAFRAKLDPADFKTDVSGLFSLTIFNDYPNTEMPYSYEVTAMTGRMAPSRWIPSTKETGNYDLVNEKYQPSSIGSVIVNGHMGDTFTDLRIVLEPHITDKTLVGKLTAAGEDQFQLVQINANQKNQDVPIRVDKFGYFKAGNISAGDMTFAIYPNIYGSIDTPCGPREYWKYSNRTVKIQIKEGLPQTYVEIPLQRAGYYWGYVTDGANTPLPNVSVWPNDGNRLDGIFGSDMTDKNGFFFISSIGLLVDDKYNINYRIGRQVKVMPNVPPNTGNLLLQ